MRKIFAFFVSMLVIASCTDPFEDNENNGVGSEGTSNLCVNNEIRYTTSDCKPLIPQKVDIAFFGANLLSNQFENGIGTLVFDKDVTSIGEGVFSDCSTLTSIMIPGSVKSIGDNAFQGCTSIAKIEIPKNVTSVAINAFYGCSSLESIKVASDNNVYDSRDNCNAIIETETNTLVVGFKNSVISNSVTKIGDSAFRDCSSLASITIPNSVTSIGDDAFYGCNNLKEVINCSVLTISKGSSENGYVGYYADKVKNLPNGLIEGDFIFKVVDGVNVLCNYFGNAINLVLPDNYKGENYEIGEYAFRDCSGLKSIEIPNSVTSIGSSAFSGCSELKSVTIGNSVTSIGSAAFYRCSGLKEVHITDLSAWCSIGFADGVVHSNPLYYAHNLYINNELATELVIPDDVTNIGSSAFYGCSSLTSVTIPNSVTSIEYSAFYDCSGLTSVVIPNSVTSIGSCAFSGCSGLASITIPNSVTSIEYNAFSRCSGLTSVEFNAENCTRMGESFYPVFNKCELLSTVIIGENVKNIPTCAFSGCSGLTSIEIPNSVTSIGDYAFYGCSGLKEVHITDLDAWKNIRFGDSYANPLKNGAKLYLNGVEVTDY